MSDKVLYHEYMSYLFSHAAGFAFQMQALTRYPRRFLTRIVTVSVRNGTCIAREASHLQGDAGGWGLIFLSKY